MLKKKDTHYLSVIYPSPQSPHILQSRLISHPHQCNMFVCLLCCIEMICGDWGCNQTV